MLPLLVLQLVDIDVLAQESRQLQSNRDSGNAVMHR